MTKPYASPTLSPLLSANVAASLSIQGTDVGIQGTDVGALPQVDDGKIIGNGLTATTAPSKPVLQKMGKIIGSG
ncbi:hypothetical protein ASE63_08360 [Bosea sp. Root381]|uniref:hypothetical protein n=1 Tax=Bosea sp. Root381 TaxID=1736524 RepID=UPI0006FB1582|nr:hypothetical protein [Bosea sp. Root381]KRE00100.1 hypothetical protein ASE63_08360 [Bosea sp. Root381]